MNRTLYLLIPIGVFCADGSAAEAPAPKRPNVLFIIADDLDLRGVFGPQSHAPNLARLRETSVNFSNAHCAVPLCGPSRACFLTGLNAHTTGWYGYGQNDQKEIKGWKEWSERPVIRDCTMLPQHFAKNGYEVFGTGKIGHGKERDDWMFTNSDGTIHWGFKPVSQGPEASSGLNQELFQRTGRKMYPAVSTPEYMPEPMRKIGRWFGPLSHVPDIPPDPKTGSAGYRGWVLFGEPFRYVSEDDRDLMTDEKSARYAVDVIRQPHDRPFMMMVGFCKPHEPLVAPQKYFDLFKDVKIDLPPYRADDLGDCAKPLRAGTQGMQAFRAVRASGEGFWQEYIRAYLACTAFMDDQLGRVLDALAASPYAGDTIIVFIGDNGYHLGEKDTIDKMTLWNESTRVPLMIRVPGLKTGGQTCSHPVGLVDLYPTLIDLCGLPANPHTRKNGPPLDGHSLVPFLEDPKSGKWDGPDVALTAWMGRPSPEQREDCMAQGASRDQHFTVCSDRYRYILADDGSEELYDHASDPNEWTNRAADPELARVKTGLNAQLKKLVGNTPEP